MPVENIKAVLVQSSLILLVMGKGTFFTFEDRRKKSGL